MSKPLVMAYSPKTLSTRWSCSIRQVYALLESGKLQGFRIGARGWRIKGEVVDAWENAGANTRLENTDSGTLTDKPSPVGGITQGRTVEELAVQALRERQRPA